MTSPPAVARALGAVALVAAIAGALPCAAAAAGPTRASPCSDVGPRPDLGRVTLVVNPGSGSADGVDLDGVPVRELGEGEDLDAVLRALADDGIAVLGVAGGDGSVGCAAQVALERGRTLWVVPGGTLNHFARDLGLADPETALEGLRRGRRSRPSTWATPTGSPSSTTRPSGVYGDLVRRREALEPRLPKRLALLIAAGLHPAHRHARSRWRSTACATASSWSSWATTPTRAPASPAASRCSRACSTCASCRRPAACRA